MIHQLLCLADSAQGRVHQARLAVRCFPVCGGKTSKTVSLFILRAPRHDSALRRTGVHRSAARWRSFGGSAYCGLAPCGRVSTIPIFRSLSVRTPAPCTRTCSRATRPPLRRPLRVTLTPLLRRARTSRCRSVSSRSTPLTPLTAR